MTRNLFPNGNPAFRQRLGAFVTALLVASTVGLHGQDNKDKDRDKKPERPAHPAPAAAPAPRPAPEPRHEVRQEPRRETPEPRREIRPEVRRETPRETRREAPEPRRESRPEVRQEIRREATPEPRREPLPTPRVEAAPHREATPGHRPVQTPESRREPTPMPRPTQQPDGRRMETPPGQRPEGLTPRRDAQPGARPGSTYDPGRTPRSTPGADRRGGTSPEVHLGPAREVVRTPKGGEIHRTSSGIIREVHTPTGAVIRHSPAGVRHVEVTRPGGRIIVANATGRAGYVQRPLVVRDHTYVQRTYIFNGVPQARIYRPWSHGGVTFHIYTPTHYYHPSFYSWGHRSWDRPVRYTWGWDRRPWYGYYGGYFSPYPTYSSPAFWLADFLIATTLETAYLAQNASYSAPPVSYSSSTALTPEVKEAIAEEVRRQIDQEKVEEAQYRRTGEPDGQPTLFSENGPKVFLVASSVFAYSGDRECPLVEGDVLQLLRTPYEDDETADVRVLSSRGGSCGKGSIVSVRLTDLQEMQNQMRATLGQGMSTLQANQGKDGLPALTADERGMVNTSYASEVRADASALEDVTQAAREANSAEQDMINQGGTDLGSPSGAATIRMGMTLAEVERAMGRPKGTVDLGKKKIYMYQDLKITFLNGRVSDVQ